MVRKLNEGVDDGVTFPPAITILTKKSNLSNHIVVGSDPASVFLIERVLDRDAVAMDHITDASLAGQSGLLLQVYAAHRLDLSPEMFGKVAIWQADKIADGSSALRELADQAFSVLGVNRKSYDKDALARLKAEVTRTHVQSAFSLFWKIAWIISGEPLSPPAWVDPWDDPEAWLPKGMSVESRLHSLHKKIARYTYSIAFRREVSEQLGVSDKQYQFFCGMRVHPARMFNTFHLLSQWKMGSLNSWVCAIRITDVWSAR
jgi:hypothetical protein